MKYYIHDFTLQSDHNGIECKLYTEDTDHVILCSDNAFRLRELVEKHLSSLPFYQGKNPKFYFESFFGINAPFDQPIQHIIATTDE